MSRMFKKTVALWLKMWYYLSIFINVLMNDNMVQLEAISHDAAIRKYESRDNNENRQIDSLRKKYKRELKKVENTRKWNEMKNKMEALGLEWDRRTAFALHFFGAIGARSLYEARDMMLFGAEGATYDEARMKAEDNNTHRLVEAEYARERVRIQSGIRELEGEIEVLDRRLESIYRRLESIYSEIARGEAVDAVAIRDASIPEYSNHVISLLGDSQGEQGAQGTPRYNIDALIVEDRLHAILVNDASVSENTDSNKSIEQSVVRSTSQIFSAQNKEREQFESDNDIGKNRIDFHKIPNNNDSALSQGLEDNESELVTQCKDISKHKTQLVTQCKDISKPVLQDRPKSPRYRRQTTSSLIKHMAVDAVHNNRAFGVKKIPRQMFINY